METSLSLEHVSFFFGRTQVIHDLSLSVQAGSFTTLLGPSGCGKTTLLRLIAGFLEPFSGRVLIDGADQRGIAPNRRAVGMVFQDYALFPHLTVEQNLRYGLKLLPREDEGRTARRERQDSLIAQTARMLALDGLLSRYPHELSGGQQQRVALGRALVLQPGILLMDEPLSSLDAQLRAQVRDELKDIQRSLGITTVYVTHDQEEALTLSDVIAVVRGGQVQQAGSPEEMYYRPANAFTAGFVGRANFLQEGSALCMVRPEWISVQKAGVLSKLLPSERGSVATGTVTGAAFMGAVTRYRIRTDATTTGELFADVPSAGAPRLAPGDPVRVTFSQKWPLPGALDQGGAARL